MFWELYETINKFMFYMLLKCVSLWTVYNFQNSLQTLANPSSASTVALVCLCKFYILFPNIYVTMQRIVTQHFGSSVAFQFILTKLKYNINIFTFKKNRIVLFSTAFICLLPLASLQLQFTNKGRREDTAVVWKGYKPAVFIFKPGLSIAH